MQFTTQLSHIAHGDISIPVTDGVVDIPVEDLDKFAVFIECGWLVAMPDVAEVVDAPADVPADTPRKKGRRNG